ncbi:Uncharacterised protein [Segatella copri]|nr:Uncharacterised protein [Segatella copri]
MLLQIVNDKPTVHTSLRINDRIKRTVKTGETVKNAFTTLPSHKGQLDVVAGSLSYLAVTLHGLSHIALDLIHICTHDMVRLCPNVQFCFRTLDLLHRVIIVARGEYYW